MRDKLEKNPMRYDTWNPYDPIEDDTTENKVRMSKRLSRDQQIVREMFPRLRQEIENPQRDNESVFQVLRSYHLNASDVPMLPSDLPEIEAQCRLVLDRGGLEQNNIQQVLLRLVGATAAPESVPFLIKMLHYTRRGDHFGPERRQLSLWGLARIAIFHNVPEAYAVLMEGLDDRRAEVRITTADLLIDAYMDRFSAHRQVPQGVIAKLQQMAESDSDKDVRRVVQRYLREPWAQSQYDDADEVMRL